LSKKLGRECFFLQLSLELAPEDSNRSEFISSKFMLKE